MTIYAFITQPYRFSEAFDNAVRSLYPTSRQVEIDGYLTNTSDADALAATIFNILKAPRQMFEVPILGVNAIKPSNMSGTPLCATLFSSRFNLSAGKLVLIPDFTIDLNAGTTTFRCWG